MDFILNHCLIASTDLVLCFVRAVEAAADRVFMAARLFVSLFNQRGASLQHHILELLALADTADNFHKKTVSAAVGGGIASVAGGIATITGLILAPFTFGTSTIVTAVGISVATAGSITSATANITDAVQSKMDRKKVEKMIQGYQTEISDIRDCLEFMQVCLAFHLCFNCLYVSLSVHLFVCLFFSLIDVILSFVYVGRNEHPAGMGF